MFSMTNILRLVVLILSAATLDLSWVVYLFDPHLYHIYVSTVAQRSLDAAFENALEDAIYTHGAASSQHIPPSLFDPVVTTFATRCRSHEGSGSEHANNHRVWACTRAGELYATIVRNMDEALSYLNAAQRLSAPFDVPDAMFRTAMIHADRGDVRSALRLLSRISMNATLLENCRAAQPTSAHDYQPLYRKSIESVVYCHAPRELGLLYLAHTESVAAFGGSASPDRIHRLVKRAAAAGTHCEPTSVAMLTELATFIARRKNVPLDQKRIEELRGRPHDAVRKLLALWEDLPLDATKHLERHLTPELQQGRYDRTLTPMLEAVDAVLGVPRTDVHHRGASQPILRLNLHELVGDRMGMIGRVLNEGEKWATTTTTTTATTKRSGSNTNPTSATLCRRIQSSLSLLDKILYDFHDVFRAALRNDEDVDAVFSAVASVRDACEVTIVDETQRKEDMKQKKLQQQREEQKQQNNNKFSSPPVAEDDSYVVHGEALPVDMDEEL
eukprot:PhM_4_TR4174/c3_g1_i1/m.78422